MSHGGNQWSCYIYLTDLNQPLEGWAERGRGRRERGRGGREEGEGERKRRERGRGGREEGEGERKGERERGGERERKLIYSTSHFHSPQWWLYRIL